MISKDCTITIDKGNASVDEDVYLYKNDMNIQILFTIVNNKYRYTKNTAIDNIIANNKASYAQVKFKKGDIEIDFEEQETKDGAVVLLIKKELIDEDTELGDYSIQIRLFDENKTSVITLPPVENCIHIQRPLFEKAGEDTNIVDQALTDMAVVTYAEPISATNSDGTYNKKTWISKEKITTAELNRMEEGISDVSTQCKDIAKQIESGNIGNNVEPALMDIPRIYFSEGTLPTTKTATMMRFDYYSKTAEYHGWAEIKCQGNSSMSYPKKNFTIKLFKDKAKTQKLKIDFKGWGKQSKFVLKANWIDLTHARNVVSARIWGDIVKSRSGYTNLPELLRTSPNQGAIDGFPIVVYGNGYYQGRYTLNIPKDKWMSNMDDSLDTHCILCGENYYSGCFLQSANINGSDWTDELHDVVPTSIKTRWNEVITFVKDSTNTDFKANLNNYIDVESAIDYLLYGIISTGLDAFGKNQIYFTYDGTKWIASMYDMDSTWGLWWNGSKFVATDYAREQFQDMTKASDCSGEGNKLYVRLQKLFINEIKARYAELRKTIFTYPYLINKFEEFIQICPSDIVTEDYASTTANGAYTGIPSKTTNNIQQLRANIKARLDYMDTYINSLVEAKPCTAITLNKSTLTLTGNGSAPKDEVIDITQNTTVGSLARGKYWVDSNHKQFGSVIKTTGDTTTDFIPFTSTNTLTITQPSSQYGCGVVAYDSNKNAIAYFAKNDIKNDKVWTTIPNDTKGTDLTDLSVNVSIPPENTAYIRLCFNLTDLSGVTVTKKYTQATTSEQLVATVTPTDTTDTVTWSISPAGFATVNNGVVTPVSNGQCTVTATCGTKSATCSVTVNLPVAAVTALSLNKDDITLNITDNIR